MIKDLQSKGNSAYAIGKILNISKNTADSYMHQSPHSHGLKGIKRVSILDPFKTKINELMSQGVFNCVRIFEELKAVGYTGRISIIKQYVHPFRPAKSLPAVQRFETDYGKQAQMDWGICTYVDEEGNEHKISAFAMVLGASRMRYVEFTKRCDLKSLERCMINAFEYFGGFPETVLTDNMKTVVNGRECGKVIWNDKFSDFAADIGFVPKVCKVRHPQTKGKVERLVRYIKESFIPGRIFSSIEDLNAQALAWCQSVNSKAHGTTGKIPAQELAHEGLNELPAKEILDRYRWECRMVQRDARVSFDGVLYGVPWQYSGHYVQIRKCGARVEIYKDDVLVAEHNIPNATQKCVHLLGQYRGLPEKHGMAFPIQRAYHCPSLVETRDLLVYERLTEEKYHVRD